MSLNRIGAGILTAVLLELIAIRGVSADQPKGFYASVEAGVAWTAPLTYEPLYYAVGFVVATGCLHAFGILIGAAKRWPLGARALRACGVAIAGCGVYFLLGHIAG